MPERVQLREPGSSLVMTVATAKPETVERNDYFLFGNGSWELLVPRATVQGRLTRLNLPSVDALVGKNVKFSRSTKMSRANKPFWDIEVLADSAPDAAKKPLPQPPAQIDPTARPTMREAYRQLTEWVVKDVAPIYDENDLSFTDATCAAIVATLFIQACKAGKVQ